MFSFLKPNQLFNMKTLLLCATVATIFIIIHSAAVPDHVGGKSSSSSEEMTTAPSRGSKFAEFLFNTISTIV